MSAELKSLPLSSEVILPKGKIVTCVGEIFQNDQIARVHALESINDAKFLIRDISGPKTKERLGAFFARVIRQFNPNEFDLSVRSKNTTHLGIPECGIEIPVESAFPWWEVKRQ